MSARIMELDKGYLSGGETWHRDPKYVTVGDRPVTTEEAAKVVDFDIRKAQTYVKSGEVYVPSGSYAIVRTDTAPETVLAPAVGERYVAIGHKQVFNHFVENLMAAYPNLKIVGSGTLENGRTWYVQFVADKFFVGGDESEHQLRLCYHQSFGNTAHCVYVTTVRIVCWNTLRMAAGDAIANKMISRFRHTKGAMAKVNTDLSLMAELKLKLQSHIDEMEMLASKPVTTEDVDAFLKKFLPEPEAKAGETEAPKVSANRWEDAVGTFNRIFVSGQDLSEQVARSRYAVLQAFTDYVDHHSYSRDESDRWTDSQDGMRAQLKSQAAGWLLQQP